MKKVLSILVCLAMLLSVTACKPDNIKYPSEIVDPGQQTPEDLPSEQEKGEDQAEESAGDGQSSEGDNAPEAENAEKDPDVEEETAEDETQSPENANQPESENTETQEEQPEDAVETDTKPEEDQKNTDGEENEEAQEVPLPLNPLAAEAFAPSTETAGSLPQSGIIKPGTAVSPLKNHTISIYTADEQPAFTYLDQHGKPVSEWDWMKSLSGQQGFLLKRQIKNKAVSLKAQRIALFAGKKLSLVQMTADELGNGMTLAASASAFLDPAKETFGISKAVLQASDDKLFAPIGNVASLWYDPASMPEATDPNALSKENKWTVEQFKAICENSPASLRLEMADPLPWATLSGRSPLTLLEGKLDSNINAAVTREVWTTIKAMDLNALQLPRSSGEEPSAEPPLFIYTASPAPAEGKTLQYAPLPAMKEGTPGTMTFTGTFFALPKYEEDAENLRAALTFAELWCNRYTEVRAAELQTLGIKGADYQAYCDAAEKQGVLILDAPEIREAAKSYLAGLTEPSIDMNAAYEEIREQINGLIAARNLYY